MKYSKIKIVCPNGRVRVFPYSAFDFYASTNELEHKEENLIITLDDLSNSFIYEVDDFTKEIMNKDIVKVELLA